MYNKYYFVLRGFIIRVLIAFASLVFSFAILLAPIGFGFWSLWALLHKEFPQTFSAPTDLIQFATSAGIICLSVLIAIFLKQVAFPASRIIKSLIGRKNYFRLPPDHKLCFELEKICKISEIYPIPKLTITGSNAIQAFVVETAWGAEIVVTSGLLDSCSANEILWVLGHELGHVKQSDSYVQALWIGTLSTIDLMFKLLFKVTELLMQLLGQVIGGILVLPLLLPAMFFKAVFHICYFTFKIVDRIYMRKSELAADKFASKLLGPSAGESILNRLPRGFEDGYLNWMNTHPSIFARLKQLRKISSN